MNRFRKEETRAHQKAREGLSAAETKLLDEQEARDTAIASLAKDIHMEWFPEEYDHQLDSIADAADRRSGINPMNADYTQRVNERRQKLGVAPLGANGMPTSNEAWEVAYREARKRVERSE